MYAGFPSTEFTFILDIIVNQSHVMKKFHGRSARDGFLLPASDTLASEKGERWPETFPSAIEKLPYRGIEFLGFPGSR
jgi:hypothetical protein